MGDLENERGRPGRQPRNVTSNQSSLEKPSRTGTAPQAQDARRVFIRASGSAFSITVEPAFQDVDFSATKDTLKAARGFAGMVGRLRGIPVTDETQGGRIE